MSDESENDGKATTHPDVRGGIGTLAAECINVDGKSLSSFIFTTEGHIPNGRPIDTAGGSVTAVGEIAPLGEEVIAHV